jgi:hypothetical protein
MGVQYKGNARSRRMLVTLFAAAAIALGSFVSSHNHTPAPAPTHQKAPTTQPKVEGASTQLASATLSTLLVKGRAPKTGYAREQFGAGWAEVDACDMRQFILRRDMDAEVLGTDNCTVLSGTLHDPYTDKTIDFKRGAGTSDDVQIDHVVALSNAWQTGAQALDEGTRAQLANDPLELLAVDGPSNQKKSDADAATWLPPNKDYRCRYVARQIAVKTKYQLWVTPDEHDAMANVLSTCPDQVLPVVD